MSGTAASLGTAAAGVGLVGLGLATGNPAFAIAGGGVVLGAAAQAFAPKPKLGGGRANSPSISISPTTPGQRIIYGLSEVPGSPLYFLDTADRIKNNPDREYLSVVYAITQGRVLDGLVALNIRGRFIGLEPNNGRVEYFPDNELCPPADSEYERFVSVHFEPGDGSAGPWQWIIDRSGGEWTEDHKLTGTAWVGVTFRFDEELFPGDIPDPFLFRVRGFRCFDPSNGQTAYTSNSALIWRDALTQYHGPGGGIPADLIDDDSVVAARNICAEDLVTKSGATVNRYECNGWWDATEDFEGVEEAILATMGGTRVQSGESLLVFAGAARASVMDLTTDDLASTPNVNLFRDREGLFNECKALFFDRTKAFAEAESVAYAPAIYREQDKGQILVQELELRAVVTQEQAQRLVKIHTEQHRRQITWSATFKPKALLLRATDVIRFTDAEKGWDLKKFIVASWEYQDGVVAMDLAEYDDAVFTWNANEEQSEAGTGADPFRSLSETQLVLIDMPAFRYGDAESQMDGFYAGFRALTPGRRTRPVRLYRSPTQNGEYQQLSIFPRPLVFGECQTTLPTAISTTQRNAAQTLTVVLDQDWSLETVDDFDLRNGANLAYVGFDGTGFFGEIVQFRTATKTGTRRWQIGDFRRGLFGTEDRTVHGADEFFMLLNGDVRFIPTGSNLRGIQRWYRIGYENRVDPFDFPFKSTGQVRRPLPPASAQLLRNSNGDLRISWQPRVRGLYGWADPAPLPEPELSFRLQIKQGSTVKREPIVTKQTHYDYLDVHQVKDFGGEQTSLTVAISQRSPNIGSGDYTTFNLSVSGTYR